MLADEVEAISTAQGEALQKLKTKLEEVRDAEHGNERDAKLFAKTEANKFIKKCKILENGLNKLKKAATSGRAVALKEQFAEVEENRSKVVKAFRQTMDAAEKSFQDLFGMVTTNDGISEGDFIAFAKKCEDLKEVEEEKLKKVFKFMAGGADCLDKETFNCAFRVFYKLVKQTVLTDNISINSSKILRRLEVAEVMEVLEGPKLEKVKNAEDNKEDDKESSTESQPVRVRALILKDNLDGWVTVAGNQGTVFLEHGGNVYKVKIQNNLTEGLDAESKCIKKLNPGALIEVMQMATKDEKSGDMRVKGMVKGDGAVGYFRRLTLKTQRSIWRLQCDEHLANFDISSYNS